VTTQRGGRRAALRATSRISSVPAINRMMQKANVSELSGTPAG